MASYACEAPAAHLGRSHRSGQPPQPPGGTPARPWPLGFGDAVAAKGTAAAVRQSASEMGRSPDPLGGQLRARRQILRSLRRGESAQSNNSLQGTAGGRWSAVRDPADSGGRMKGSTWNGTDGSSSEQPQLALSLRPSGTRAGHFRIGPAPRSVWNPTGIGRPGQDRRGEDPWFSLSSP